MLYYDEHDIPVSVFIVDDEDRERFPRLESEGIRRIEIWEDDSGFVHTRVRSR